MSARGDFDIFPKSYRRKKLVFNNYLGQFLKIFQSVVIFMVKDLGLCPNKLVKQLNYNQLWKNYIS